MTEKKKLIGVYLPLSLIARLKRYISNLFLETGVEKTQSDIVDEAVEEYLDRKEKNK